MTTPVFRDDSSIADKRAAAVERLMGLCPAPMRPLFRPQVELAVRRASDDDIAALMLDVDAVVTAAQSGDPNAVNQIIDTAKKYGASDSQILAFQHSVSPQASNDPYEQFGAFLPKG